MDIKSKLKLLDKHKVPKTYDNHVGIEIEFLSKNNTEYIKRLLIKYKLEKQCQIGTDSSVRDDLVRAVTRGNSWINSRGEREYETFEELVPIRKGHELRILSTEGKLKDTLDKVQKVLQECKAAVNKTCGLHIHIDMRQRPFFTGLRQLVTQLPNIKKMVSKDRHQSEYCRFNKDLKTILEHKYNAINGSSMRERYTIEVRAHEGTVNCKDIYDWANYLLAIVDGKQLNKGLLSYVKHRKAISKKVG